MSTSFSMHLPQSKICALAHPRMSSAGGSEQHNDSLNRQQFIVVVYKWNDVLGLCLKSG